KGIPRYVDTANGIDDNGDGTIDEVGELDRFIDDGGEELVPTADGFFFSKNESRFVRYARVPGHCAVTAAHTCLANTDCPASEDCDGVHWDGTLPDGTRQEFGVTAQARLTDVATGRVLKWLLERSTDTNGNTVLYSYRGFDGAENLNQRYPALIAYGPGAP